MDPNLLNKNIQEIGDEIVGKTLICKETSKPYTLTKQELAFYKKMNLPLPKLCFEARHQRRMKHRNPRGLKTESCIKCTILLKTTSADREVYCQNCYLEEMN